MAPAPPIGMTVAGMTGTPEAWIIPVVGVLGLAGALIGRRSARGESERSAALGAVAAALRSLLAVQARAACTLLIGVCAILAAAAIAGAGSIWTAAGCGVGGLLTILVGGASARMALRAAALGSGSKALGERVDVTFAHARRIGLFSIGAALAGASASVWLGHRVAPGAHTGTLSSAAWILTGLALGAACATFAMTAAGSVAAKAADIACDLATQLTGRRGTAEDRPVEAADLAGDLAAGVAARSGQGFAVALAVMAAGTVLGESAAAQLDVSSGAAARLGSALSVLPAMVLGGGLIACWLAGWLAGRSHGTDARVIIASVRRWIALSSVLAIAGAMAAPLLIFGRDADFAGAARSAGLPSWAGLGLCGVVGVICAAAAGRWMERCSAYDRRPARRVAGMGEAGAGPAAIAAVSDGVKSVWLPLLTVAIAAAAGSSICGGRGDASLSLLGVAISAAGACAWLSTAIACSAVSAIIDCAAGLADTGGAPPSPQVGFRVVGDTAAPAGRGVAIVGVGLAMISLCGALPMAIRDAMTQDAVRTAAGIWRLQGHAGEGRAFAVAESGSRFALVIPQGDPGNDQSRDAALGGLILTDPHQLASPDELDHLSPEHRLDVAPPSPGRSEMEPSEVAAMRLLRLSTTFRHGDHGHTMSFTAVRIAHAAPEDIIAAVGGWMGSVRLWVGLLAGAGTAFLVGGQCGRASGRSAYSAAHDQPTRPAGSRWLKGALGMAVIVPLLIVTIAGPAALLGVSAGAGAAGLLVAIFGYSAGGAAQGARRLIESYGTLTATSLLEVSAGASPVPPDLEAELRRRAEALRANGRGSEVVYGRGSDEHCSLVQADALGDVLKDVLSPVCLSLAIMLPLLMLAIAGVSLRLGPWASAWLGISGW